MSRSSRRPGRLSRRESACQSGCEVRVPPEVVPPLGQQHQAEIQHADRPFCRPSGPGYFQTRLARNSVQ
jgi:hypothetical protein